MHGRLDRDSLSKSSESSNLSLPISITSEVFWLTAVVSVRWAVVYWTELLLKQIGEFRDWISSTLASAAKSDADIRSGESATMSASIIDPSLSC